MHHVLYIDSIGGKLIPILRQVGEGNIAVVGCCPPHVFDQLLATTVKSE